MTNKSVLNYQNFKLTTENFPRWYRALKRHLTALDLIDCIKKDLDITEMDDDELKEDCATQTIIESSLDSTTAELIEGCETSYEMIIRLESYFLQVGPSKLYQIEYQIKKLEVENDDIKLYIDKLNYLFQLHDKESKRCEKTKLDEETKILLSAEEIVKFGVPPVLLVEFKTFEELKERIALTSVFIKKYKDKKKIDYSNETTQELSVNRVRNGKLPYKFNNDSDKDKEKEKYCYICHKHGHTTDECILNPRRKDRRYNKNPSNGNIRHQERSGTLRNNSKNKNYRSNNIEGIKNTTDLEDSDEFSEDEIFTEFSGNINVNAVSKDTSIFNQKKEPTRWIIDSGTSLNLTKEEKDLDDTKIVNNKIITYPDGKSDKIVKVGTYNGTIKNFDFKLSKVHYAPNIKNNLISTHYLVRNNFTIIIDFDEYLNKDRLQLFKNNKQVAKIYADKENLFSLYTTPFKMYKSLNIDISNFDYDLWHARLGHFNNNKDIKKFVLNHTCIRNKKDSTQCKISKMRRKPFYAIENSTTQPLQLVHSNVVGKLKTSYNDFNYYVTFMDDYSRRCWIYLIKNKSDVYNAFIKFHKLMNNTTIFTIKTLKTDNGIEYTNENFNKYLSENGIKLIHSTPGYPQQNGRSERINQTLNNCGTTLL